MQKLNFYEMVIGQNAMDREVIGTRATLVTDQNTYEVTDVKAGKLIMTEVVNDGKAEPNVVEITADNGIVMKYQYNPNPKVKVDATFEDGNLKFGNFVISCGTLPITGVLASVPGLIFLKAEVADTDKIGVYIYEPQFDRFTEVQGTLSKDAYAVELESGTYVVSNLVKEVALIDAFGVPTGETKEVLVEARLIRATECGLQVYSELVFDSPIASVIDADRHNVAVITNQMTDENGFLAPAEKNLVRVYSYDLESRLCKLYTTSMDARVYFGGPCSAVITCFDGNDAIIIKHHEKVTIVTDKNVVAEMKGYVAFAAFFETKSDKDEDVAVWTYTNDKLEVKSFSVTTTDRGDFFAIV